MVHPTFLAFELGSFSADSGERSSVRDALVAAADRHAKRLRELVSGDWDLVLWQGHDSTGSWHLLNVHVSISEFAIR